MPAFHYTRGVGGGEWLIAAKGTLITFYSETAKIMAARGHGWSPLYTSIRIFLHLLVGIENNLVGMFAS